MEGRHLEPYEWGPVFTRLLAERGVKTGQGANQGKHSATVAECAAELGVPERSDGRVSAVSTRDRRAY